MEHKILLHKEHRPPQHYTSGQFKQSHRISKTYGSWGKILGTPQKEMFVYSLREGREEIWQQLCKRWNKEENKIIWY